MALLGNRSKLIVTEPVHLQLARVCRDELSAGRCGVGDRFPSERELAMRYGVSRSTANKVLSALAAERWLIHKPGVGMFVSPRRGLSASLREVESFTDHAQAAGYVPSTVVLNFRRERAENCPMEVMTALGLKPGADALYFRRLRCANGEPVILEDRWVPAARFKELKKSDLAGSFYRLLETKFNTRIFREQQSIQAKNLDPVEARLLAVPNGAAALVVKGPGFDETDHPIWFQSLFYRGDRYYLESSTQSPRDGGEAALKLRT